MADLIKKTDTLNQGREKLNNAIKAFNETVVKGDSSVEAAQARVSTTGTAYGTLKQRLDTEYEEVTTRLAQLPTQEQVNAKRDKSVKLTKDDLDTSSDSVKLTEVNLSETLLQQIAGTTPIGSVPADGSITKEKLADGAITVEKFSENPFANFPWLSDNTFDLNYIWREGNYMINTNVKNNPTGSICFLEVTRAKTTPGSNNVWVTQKITSTASNVEVYERIILIVSNVISYVRDWVKLNNEGIKDQSITFEMLTSQAKDKLFTDYKKKLGLNVVNMNWAQLEHNFNITTGKFAYYNSSQGVHYRDNAIFGYSEIIKVNEGEIWRVLTRVEDSISWTLDARGLLLDENNNFVDFIPVDSGKTNSGVSTVIIPKGVKGMIVNVLNHSNNQTQTHILKLHDFKNIWDKNIYGYEKDKFISNTGTLTTPSSAKLAVTGAIPVNAGEIYRIANVNSGGEFNFRGAFLDDNDNLVKAIPNPNGVLPYTYNDVIVPVGATKMRVNYLYEIQSRTDTTDSISINLAIPAKPKYSNDFLYLLDKRIAFYGDSTTWYAGQIRLIQNATGIKPYIHGHSSASLSTKNASNTLCDDARINELMASDPNIVFINGGLNDSNGTLLGDTSDFKVALGSEDKSTFYGAYAYIIKKILTIKPTVKIILWTTTFYNVGYNNDSTTPNTSLDYAKATKEVAEYFGLTVADVRHNMQTNWYTNDIYLSDNIHHSFRGDEAVAGTMLRELKNINWVSA